MGQRASPGPPRLRCLVTYGVRADARSPTSSPQMWEGMNLS
ncbi:hypothetical protein HMPREF1979_00693 [Actinomyces johnsonii F0542]|uniref:Uncharacterized protein n=1 Tax=Actinomyces johnsonii F0542 TaxID=1321818 RepID=U1RZX2_9ACTO|nr:hypothetical protein HMPREF1979_00693 [Actinomyces johnsonii F0542]